MTLTIFIEWLCFGWFKHVNSFDNIDRVCLTVRRTVIIFMFLVSYFNDIIFSESLYHGGTNLIRYFNQSSCQFDKNLN